MATDWLLNAANSWVQATGDVKVRYFWFLDKSNTFRFNVNFQGKKNPKLYTSLIFESESGVILKSIGLAIAFSASSLSGFEFLHETQFSDDEKIKKLRNSKNIKPLWWSWSRLV
jgi:hypothetical protein